MVSDWPVPVAEAVPGIHAVPKCFLMRPFVKTMIKE